MPDHSLPADEGAAIGSSLDRRGTAKVTVAVNPVPSRRLRRTAAGEDLITERDGFRLRREIEFLPQDRLAAVELAYCLVRCSHPHVQAHQLTMNGFSRRVLLEHIAEPFRRFAVGAAPLEHFCHPEQQPDMQLLHGIATLVAPALVAVLRQQLTAVSGESSVICRDFPAAQRVLGQPLEFVGVDSDTLGVEGKHAVRQTEIRRILTSRQGRLQRAAGDMKSLTEAIERRFRVHLRPEDVDDLLAVHRVSRLDGQKLDQGLGAPPRPIGYGLARRRCVQCRILRAASPAKAQSRSARNAAPAGHLPPAPADGCPCVSGLERPRHNKRHSSPALRRR